MKLRLTKTWVAALGLALTVSTAGGVAIAAGAGPGSGNDEYTGGNATVVDPNNIGATLKLYDAGGAPATGGTLDTPLAAYAAADTGTAFRAGDEYASLFVHLAQSNTAPGAWPGVQVTGTDKFAGTGAVSGAPTGVAGKAFVRTTAAGYSLADVQAALPNPAGNSAALANIYELRLRTSSPTVGVGDKYAVAYVKITGNNWAVVDAPALGGGGGTPTPTAVGTTVAATWPGSLTYGTASTVNVTVNPASGTAKPTGTVRLVSGSTTLSTATLSASGTASLPLAKTALPPGSAALKVVYPGVTNAFNASETSKTITVGKATPGQPTFKVTTKPTPTKKGAATVTVAAPSGLVAATGKLQLVIKLGNVSKKAKGKLKNGTATVKLPKLAKGKWTVTITYQGDTYYLTSTSKAFKLKVK